MSQNSSVSKLLRSSAWPAAIILACAALLVGVPFALRSVKAQSTGTPRLTTPTVSAVFETTATISWNTDIESSSIVEYGKTSSLELPDQRNIQFNGPGVPETDESRFSHSVQLNELTPGTQYFFRAKSDTDPSTTSDPDAGVSGVSSFTTKSATPSCTEDTWECTSFGQCSVSGTQTRACTLKVDCPTAQTPKPSESQTCTPPPPACTADTWECTAFGECKIDGTQSRACSLKTDCATTQTPKPAETQSCAPSCTADVWECTSYSECKTDSTQTRACTLKTDCPTATTPKPATSQKCTPPPACTEDRWICDPYVETCRADGTQTRTCRLEQDCPGVTTPKPATSQKCTPPPACTEDRWICDPYVETCRADGTQGRECTLTIDCPVVETPKPETSRPCAYSQTVDANEPRDYVTPATSPVGASHTFLWDSAADIGVLPGTLLSVDLKASIDDLSASIEKSDWVPDQDSKATGAAVSDLYASINGGEECKAAGVNAGRCSVWLAAKYADRTCLHAGIQTRESCEKFLSDKNGGVFPGCENKIPAECEKVKALTTIGYLTKELREKTDEVVRDAVRDNVMVSITGITAFAKVMQPGLAWYPSAKGDKETSAALVVADFDNDGLPDSIEMRLGLNPRDMDSDDDGVRDSKVTRAVLKGYFMSGHIPTQEQFFESLGGNGDKPTQAQFSTFIDSVLNLSDSDRAIINGHPLEQPLGAGQFDETFTIVLSVPPSPSESLSFDPNNVYSASQGQDMDPNSPQQYPRLFGGDPNSPYVSTADGRGTGSFADCHDNCLGSCGGRSECVSACDDACRAGSSNGDVNDAGPVSGFVVPHVFDTDRGAALPGDPNMPAGQDQANMRTRINALEQMNVLHGHALPNTTVLLYIYSYVPMVLTTTTDDNGNYSYDLGASIADGEHTVYVAVTDDTGKITKKSNPLTFFVSEAQAASESDFLKPDITPVNATVADLKRYYVIGTAALIIVAATIAMSFVMGTKRKGSVKP